MIKLTIYCQFYHCLLSSMPKKATFLMQEDLGSAVLHLLVVSFRSNDIWIPFESMYDLCIGKAAGLVLCLFVVRLEGKFTRNDDEQNITETYMLMKFLRKTCLCWNK